MATQEENLDDLLNDVTSDTNIEDDLNDGFIGIDEADTMSETDISEILSQDDEIGGSDIDNLMDLLKDSDDEELQDMHELLKKSEDNELIDTDVFSLLQGEDEEDVMNPKSSQQGVLAEQDTELSDSEKMGLDELLGVTDVALDGAEQLNSEIGFEESEGGKTEDKELENLIFDDIMPDMMSDILPEVSDVHEEDESILDALPQETDEMVVENKDENSNLNVLPQEEIEKKEESVKKKGFFTKLLGYLIEDDDLESEDEIKLSEENKNILNELEQEKGNKKKKPKVKKEKKKKNGKNENLDEGDEESPNPSKKERKVKRPKKEKKAASVVAEENVATSKLSMKRILPIISLCITIGAVIILSANLSGDFISKRNARKAYNEGDYQGCYQNLYGKNLNETEQIMFGKSESILRIRLWMREYELFVEEQLEAQALDSLIQSVKDYPKLYQYSSRWNASNEVSQIYNQMLDILKTKYHLSEEQALKISDEKNDADYSRMIYAIVDGNEFGSWDDYLKEDKDEEIENGDILEDILPEEEELGKVEFIENA